MTEIKKILVPIDFSKESRAALDLALEFARRFDAHVSLFHCYQIAGAEISAYDIKAPDDFFRAVKKAAGEKLDSVRDAVREEGITISAEVRAGVPSQAICEIAGEIHADLIVMGTRGMGGLKHVIVGSVAERTLRGAPCPVVTVKGNGRG